VKRRNIDMKVRRSAGWLSSSRYDGAAPYTAAVDKESELEINPLPCLQPVQLAEKWSDVVEP